MKLLPVLCGFVLASVSFLSPLAFGGGLCEGVPNAGVVCGPGNPDPNVNVITQTVLPRTAELLLNIVAGLSVLFIVWGGILMLLSMGDDSKTAQAKWAIAYALIGLFGAVLSQAFVGWMARKQLVFGATESTVIQKAVEFLVNAMNVVFIAAIIFAGIRMLLGHGQPEEFTRAKKTIAWAIAGALVVNVARTLVRAVLSVFGV